MKVCDSSKENPLEEYLGLPGYVDKTAHIREIFKDGLLISLIARPPRFGKTSMLRAMQAFLELDYEEPGSTARQEKLFKDSALLEDADFCRENMGRWPVVAFSFTAVEGRTFSEALCQIAREVEREWVRHRSLLKSERLSPELRKMAQELCVQVACADAAAADQLLVQIQTCLRVFERALFEHFGRRAVLLIDDYDAPLARASARGFYKEMNDALHRILNAADGPELRKAVLMGRSCLSPEGSPTGYNNFVPHPASAGDFPEAFGFTEAETEQLLARHGLSERLEEVRECFGGYRAGETELYSPEGVMAFCRKAVSHEAFCEESVWAGPDGNHRLNEFLNRADPPQLETLAALLAGETVPVEIEEAIACDRSDSRPTTERLLSALYADGYLTCVGRVPEGELLIRIPNAAVRACIRKCVEQHFGAGGKQFQASAEAFA